MPPATPTRIIALAEVKKHNKTNDLWMVINGKVYDLTKFRDEHPGGDFVLDEFAGRDGTKGFVEAGHSLEAKKMMPKYCIGLLDPKDMPGIPYREIGIAVGAIVLGVAVVFVVRKIMAK